jgi:hypothetical protein
MTNKAICNKIFKDCAWGSSQKFVYDDFVAWDLYRQGVSYKRLAIAKWKFVLKCKKKGIKVIRLYSACGYCMKYMCVDCPLYEDEKGAVWCATYIQGNSNEMTLKCIKYVLKCVKRGKVLNYRSFNIF